MTQSLKGEEVLLNFFKASPHSRGRVRVLKISRHKPPLPWRERVGVRGVKIEGEEKNGVSG